MSIQKELLLFSWNLDCSTGIYEVVLWLNKIYLVFLEIFRSNGCIWLNPSVRIKKETGFLVAFLPFSLPHPFKQQVTHEESSNKKT